MLKSIVLGLGTLLITEAAPRPAVIDTCPPPETITSFSATSTVTSYATTITSYVPIITTIPECEGDVCSTNTIISQGQPYTLSTLSTSTATGSVGQVFGGTSAVNTGTYVTTVSFPTFTVCDGACTLSGTVYDTATVYYSSSATVQPSSTTIVGGQTLDAPTAVIAQAIPTVSTYYSTVINRATITAGSQPVTTSTVGSDGQTTTIVQPISQVIPVPSNLPVTQTITVVVSDPNSSINSPSASIITQVIAPGVDGAPSTSIIGASTLTNILHPTAVLGPGSPLTNVASTAVPGATDGVGAPVQISSPAGSPSGVPQPTNIAGIDPNIPPSNVGTSETASSMPSGSPIILPPSAVVTASLSNDATLPSGGPGVFPQDPLNSAASGVSSGIFGSLTSALPIGSITGTAGTASVALPTGLPSEISGATSLPVSQPTLSTGSVAIPSVPISTSGALISGGPGVLPGDLPSSLSASILISASVTVSNLVGSSSLTIPSISVPAVSQSTTDILPIVSQSATAIVSDTFGSISSNLPATSGLSLPTTLAVPSITSFSISSASLTDMSAISSVPVSGGAGALPGEPGFSSLASDIPALSTVSADVPSPSSIISGLLSSPSVALPDVSTISAALPSSVLPSISVIGSDVLSSSIIDVSISASIPTDLPAFSSGLTIATSSVLPSLEASVTAPIAESTVSAAPIATTTTIPCASDAQCQAAGLAACVTLQGLPITDSSTLGVCVALLPSGSTSLPSSTNGVVSTATSVPCTSSAQCSALGLGLCLDILGTTIGTNLGLLSGTCAGIDATQPSRSSSLPSVTSTSVPSATQVTCTTSEQCSILGLGLCLDLLGGLVTTGSGLCAGVVTSGSSTISISLPLPTDLPSVSDGISASIPLPTLTGTITAPATLPTIAAPVTLAASSLLDVAKTDAASVSGILTSLINAATQTGSLPIQTSISCASQDQCASLGLGLCIDADSVSAGLGECALPSPGSVPTISLGAGISSLLSASINPTIPTVSIPVSISTALPTSVPSSCLNDDDCTDLTVCIKAPGLGALDLGLCLDGATQTSLSLGAGLSASAAVPSLALPTSLAGDLSSVTDIIPSLTDDLPSATGILPSVTVPSITGDLPAVTDALPSLTALPSSDPEILPTGIISSITADLPSITEIVPSATDIVPSVTDIVPTLSAALPSVSEVLPSVSVALPSVTGIIPTVSDVLPSVSNILSSVILPTSLSVTLPTELPSVSEGLPAVSEILTTAALPTSLTVALPSVSLPPVSLSVSNVPSITSIGSTLPSASPVACTSNADCSLLGLGLCLNLLDVIGLDAGVCGLPASNSVSAALPTFTSPASGQATGAATTCDNDAECALLGLGLCVDLLDVIGIDGGVCALASAQSTMTASLPEVSASAGVSLSITADLSTISLPVTAALPTTIPIDTIPSATFPTVIVPSATLPGLGQPTASSRSCTSNADCAGLGLELCIDLVSILGVETGVCALDTTDVSASVSASASIIGAPTVSSIVPQATTSAIPCTSDADCSGIGLGVCIDLLDVLGIQTGVCALSSAGDDVTISATLDPATSSLPVVPAPTATAVQCTKNSDCSGIGLELCINLVDLLGVQTGICALSSAADPPATTTAGVVSSTSVIVPGATASAVSCQSNADCSSLGLGLCIDLIDVLGVQTGVCAGSVSTDVTQTSLPVALSTASAPILTTTALPGTTSPTSCTSDEQCSALGLGLCVNLIEVLGVQTGVCAGSIVSISSAPTALFPTLTATTAAAVTSTTSAVSCTSNTQCSLLGLGLCINLLDVLGVQTGVCAGSVGAVDTASSSIAAVLPTTTALLSTAIAPIETALPVSTTTVALPATTSAVSCTSNAQCSLLGLGLCIDLLDVLGVQTGVCAGSVTSGASLSSVTPVLTTSTDLAITTNVPIATILPVTTTSTAASATASPVSCTSNRQCSLLGLGLCINLLDIVGVQTGVCAGSVNSANAVTTTGLVGIVTTSLVVPVTSITAVLPTTTAQAVIPTTSIAAALPTTTAQVVIPTTSLAAVVPTTLSTLVLPTTTLITRVATTTAAVPVVTSLAAATTAQAIVTTTTTAAAAAATGPTCSSTADCLAAGYVLCTNIVPAVVVLGQVVTPAQGVCVL